MIGRRWDAWLRGLRRVEARLAAAHGLPREGAGRGRGGARATACRVFLSCFRIVCCVLDRLKCISPAVSARFLEGVAPPQLTNSLVLELEENVEKLALAWFPSAR